MSPLQRLFLLAATSALALSSCNQPMHPPGQTDSAQEACLRLDLYGEPLPDGAVARLGALRRRVPVETIDFALAPDGKTLASATEDNLIQLWDVATGKELRRFEGHKASVWAVAFSPDGRTLASGDTASRIFLWEPATGKRIAEMTSGRGGITSLAFSPDGKELAAGDRDGLVQVWTLPNGEKGTSFLGKESACQFVAYSPDGRFLASGSLGQIHVWDRATRERVRRFDASEGCILYPVFSSDGAKLATGAAETVQVWSLATGEETLRFRARDLNRKEVGLSPDGESIVYCSENRSDAKYAIHVCDAISGEEVKQFPIERQYRGHIQFSSDGKTLVCAGQDFLFVDLTTSRIHVPVARHANSIHSAAFSPNGELIASASREHTIRLWDAATGKQILEIVDPKGEVWRVAFSPDGQTLASAGPFTKVRLWSVPTGRELCELPVPGRTIYSLAFSPGGTVLATADAQGICLIDLTTRKIIRQLKVPKGDVRLLDFTPDGDTLVSCGWDEGIRLWNLGAREDPCPSRVLLSWEKPGRCGTGMPEYNNSLHISPDGRTLFAAIDFRTLKVLDMATGEERPSPVRDGWRFTSIALSPNGKLLVIGCLDGTIRLVDTATGKVRQRFVGHQGEVLPMTFSPDGKRLVSGGKDTTLLVWDVSEEPVTGP